MRRSRRLALASLAAVPIFLGTGQQAWAMCAAQLPFEQIGRADVIASGVVTAVAFASNRLTFRPAVVYRGTLEPGPIIVRTGPINEPDGVTFRHTGEDYFANASTVHTLYLLRDADAFTTNSCSGSHEGTASGIEIALLGSGRSVDSGGGPLVELWDQLAVIPPVVYLAILLVVLVIVLVRRSRRGPPFTPLSGAPA